MIRSFISSSWRVRAARLASLLTVGALVNLAFCWTIAFWVPVTECNYRGDSIEIIGENVWRISYYKTLGKEHVTAYYLGLVDSIPIEWMNSGDRGNYSGDVPARILRFSRQRISSRSTDANLEKIVFESQGFPCLSFRGEYTVPRVFGSGPDVEPTNCIALIGDDEIHYFSVDAEYRILCFAPISFGMLLNTAAGATLVGVILWFYLWLRQLMLRRICLAVGIGVVLIMTMLSPVSVMLAGIWCFGTEDTVSYESEWGQSVDDRSGLEWNIIMRRGKGGVTILSYWEPHKIMGFMSSPPTTTAEALVPGWLFDHVKPVGDRSGVEVGLWGWPHPCIWSVQSIPFSDTNLADDCVGRGSIPTRMALYPGIVNYIWFVLIWSVVFVLSYGLFVVKICSRKKRGCCLCCGYDLREHRAGDCCPECSQVWV